MALHETEIAPGTAVTAGKLYVAVAPGAKK
jgi:hypothetical protein